MQKKLTRWMILLFGFIMILGAGLIFSWSVFVGSIESDLGFSRNSTSFVFTLAVSLSIVGQIIGGIITKKKSARLTFMIAAILLTLGFAGASFTTKITHLYLFFGTFCGIGTGMVYNTIITVVTQWFPDKPGVASGFLLMGFGVSGIVLGTLSAHIITLVGWRTTFIILAIFFALLISAGSLIVKPPLTPVQAKNTKNKEEGIHPLKMMKKRSFIMFFIWSTFTGSSSLLIIGHAALYATDIGVSIGTAALAAGVISTFNGLSRILFGYLYEKLDASRVMNLVSAVLLAGALVILVAYTNQSIELLFIGFALVGVGYGGNPPIVNLYIKERYGNNYFGINLGIANAHMAIGSFMGPTIAAFLKTNYGSYTPAIYSMLLMVFLSFIFPLGIGKKQSRI